MSADTWKRAEHGPRRRLRPPGDADGWTGLPHPRSEEQRLLPLDAPVHHIRLPLPRSPLQGTACLPSPKRCSGGRQLVKAPPGLEAGGRVQPPCSGGKITVLAWISGLRALGSWRGVLMFYLNGEVLIGTRQCFHIPQRSVPPSPLSPPVCSAPISRLLQLLQNLLGASGMVKQSVHYTVLSETNLSLGGCGAGGAGWSWSSGSCGLPSGSWEP